MGPDYSIRQRRDNDSGELVRVENTAAELFRGAGHPEVADHPIPDIEWIERNLLAGRQAFVAVDRADRPVGFAVAEIHGCYVHLHELSVDPAHGRRGIGAALVDRVSEYAAQSGKAGVSLTTYRHVPFNAPYYARLGFVEMPANAPADLLALLEKETPPGSALSDRILMVRELA